MAKIVPPLQLHQSRYIQMVLSPLIPDTQPCGPPALRPALPTPPAVVRHTLTNSPLLPPALHPKHTSTATQAGDGAIARLATLAPPLVPTLPSPPREHHLEHIRTAAEAGDGAVAVLGDLGTRCRRDDRGAGRDVDGADTVPPGTDDVNHCDSMIREGQ